jgi:thioredoxin 1
MAKVITDSNLEETLKTDKLVVIDFSAGWCSPCKMMAPIVEELSAEHTDVVIGKVDVDENPESSAKYGVRSIPAIYFIKNGEVVDKIIGACKKSDLAAKIDTLK